MLIPFNTVLYKSNMPYIFLENNRVFDPYHNDIKEVDITTYAPTCYLNLGEEECFLTTKKTIITPFGEIPFYDFIDLVCTTFEANRLAAKRNTAFMFVKYGIKVTTAGTFFKIGEITYTEEQFEELYNIFKRFLDLEVGN